MNNRCQWMSLVSNDYPLGSGYSPIANHEYWIANWMNRQHSLARCHCHWTAEAWKRWVILQPANQDHMCQQRTPFIRAITCGSGCDYKRSPRSNYAFKLVYTCNTLNLSFFASYIMRQLRIISWLLLSQPVLNECLWIWATWNKYDLLTTISDTIVSN